MDRRRTSIAWLLLAACLAALLGVELDARRSHARELEQLAQPIARCLTTASARADGDRPGWTERRAATCPAAPGCCVADPALLGRSGAAPAPLTRARDARAARARAPPVPA